ncbi:MAG: DUF2069 domain-containing protein [Burkholderiales bacterium]|jgi:uncharacterized membrane protein
MSESVTSVPASTLAAIRLTRQFTLFCFVALAVLAIGWEIWWAPLKPGGSMLAIKALPLLMALPFLARGSLKAYQWWSMLVMLYLCEGLVRVVSDPSLVGRWLGGIEAALSAMAFGAVVVYVRMASRARQISE